MSEESSEQQGPTAGVHVGRAELTFWRRSADGKEGCQHTVRLADLIQRAQNHNPGAEAELLQWGQFMLLDEIRQTAAFTAQMQAEALKRAREAGEQYPVNPEQMVSRAMEALSRLPGFGSPQGQGQDTPKE